MVKKPVTIESKFNVFNMKMASGEDSLLDKLKKNHQNV